jgi:hypothetical protein
MTNDFEKSPFISLCDAIGKRTVKNFFHTYPRPDLKEIEDAITKVYEKRLAIYKARTRILLIQGVLAAVIFLQLGGFSISFRYGAFNVDTASLGAHLTDIMMITIVLLAPLSGKYTFLDFVLMSIYRELSARQDSNARDLFVIVQSITGHEVLKQTYNFILREPYSIIGNAFVFAWRSYDFLLGIAPYLVGIYVFWLSSFRFSHQYLDHQHKLELICGLILLLSILMVFGARLLKTTKNIPLD